MRRKVSEDNKLYGSVSVADIAKALEERGFETREEGYSARTADKAARRI